MPRKPNTNRWHSGESLVYGIACVDATGAPGRHRVKLSADGRVMVLDHSRAELTRTLLCHELSGEAPDGCYAILAAVRGHPPVWVRGDTWRSARSSGFAGQLIVARHGVAGLRALLRAGGLHVYPVKSAASPSVWVISANRAKAEAVASADLPVGPLVGKRTLVSFGGFVVVRVPHMGRICWDVALPGVSNLLSQGSELVLPGPLALVRLSRQLLRGWRGVLATGASGARRPAPRGAPCRPSA